MARDMTQTVVQYELEGDERGKFSLEVGPLIAFRDYHSTTHENGALNTQIETAPGLTTFRPYSDLPALPLAHDPAEIDSQGF